KDDLGSTTLLDELELRDRVSTWIPVAHSPGLDDSRVRHKLDAPSQDDSADREISSPVAALAFVKLRSGPPNVMAIPAITCRRVGEFAVAVGFLLSLIIVFMCPPWVLAFNFPSRRAH